MFWTTRITILAFTLIGGGLVFQPDRFSRTPSYANLLHIWHADVWGWMYLAVALLLLTWHRRRSPQWWGVAVHTVAAMLTAGWLAAFVVRYFTDASTTIVNVVSWTVFLSLILVSAADVYDTAS